ncbi:MAG: helix-turn-helix transcriptional regulator [Magnetococcales bacterium]|nr:helix-turn-helix transcriptional regulator [Magnetococcales bacterium]
MHAIRDTNQLIAVGARLRAAREAIGCRQKAICFALNIGITTWNNWENGKRLPDPLVMARFQAKFRVSLDWIYAGDPSMLPYALAEKVLALVDKRMSHDVVIK